MVILLIILVVSGSIWLHQKQKSDLKFRAQNQLITVANLKINQIMGWRAERIANGKELMESPFLMTGFSQWFSEYPHSESDEIIQKFRSIQNIYNYINIFLTDTSGNILLSLSDEKKTIERETGRMLDSAFTLQKPILTDIYKDENDSLYIDVVTPIFSENREGVPLCAIIMRINPVPFLFSTVQSWPVPSFTSETQIVRLEDDSVLYLNTVRHKPGSAFNLKIPLSQTKVAAVNAVQGNFGIFEGIDYRGEEVLAVTYPIPESSWYDGRPRQNKKEAFSIMRQRLAMILIITGGFLLLILSILGYIWLSVRKKHEKELFEVEIRRLALVRHFEYLIKYANDIILLTDKDHRIIEANEKALETYGYSKNEILGMNMKEIMAPESIHLFEKQVEEILNSSSYFGETIHRKKEWRKPHC
ncbi:MAG: PAS domain S-box protein [Bacteroidales bacterium]|nr:PAS domain S-box protein [Bacteroidales bacterium]